MPEEKQLKFDKAYLRIAHEWGKLSHCKRKQVGAVIVKDKMIISDGYNGTPTGFENPCENEEGDTKWYVLHAEANAILKVAALIYQSGIKRVVYHQEYKDRSGLKFLEKAGVEIIKIEKITVQ